VHELKEGQDPFLVYEDFQKYKEFHANLPLPRKKVLKYIIYFYEKNTPLLGMDVFRAKLKAAELAGFQKVNKQFEEMVEKMILCEVAVINDMITRFISMNHDIKYQKFHVLQEVYFRASQQLLSGEKDSIKGLTDAATELLHLNYSSWLWCLLLLLWLNQWNNQCFN